MFQLFWILNKEAAQMEVKRGLQNLVTLYTFRSLTSFSSVLEVRFA